MGDRDGQGSVDQGSVGPGAGRAEPELQPVIEAMATLRRRCPWSSRQDHQSLEKYAREETDELIVALEDFTTEPTAENRAAVVEELGDVFYQVLFHSALLDESSGQAYGHSLGIIIDGLEAKLLRRHPLAFTDDPGAEMASLEDVEREYRRIKAEEKAAVRGEDGSR
ncbi:MazG nucleotide pyrophosphohydrolase domain-containing protein [Brevibacterium sp. JSBI002]|uniref:MazG nucleotide pyrophosphohydrolase domain-containing protein n=1 Tax=Brevibacterium sp. JSBI002 TaxID=2886045 RepID=UPI002231672F|nr:MazG nucleotide pyrophosphohydrolase domain-containing protein [Brevibacterium sp. JSBI002]UZD63252.1 MazG family protein [Brevibacterium sp. JSBI002]